MRLARVLGAIGRTLITAGVLILLFVAYQLWGTGIREAQAQNRLEDDFAEVLAEADEPATTTSSTTSSTSSTSSTSVPESTTTSEAPPEPVPPIEAVPEGEATARIRIPKIGVDKIVVEGVSLRDLKKGPGHYPETPLPGQKGNAAIAGHRTTYGAPFSRIDELEAGDEVFVETVQGEFRYLVSEQQIISPTQVEVLDDKGDNRLTLTACHPKLSSKQRIVIHAVLVGNPVARLAGQGAEPSGGSEASAPRTAIDEFASEPIARFPGAWWGLVCVAVWGLVRLGAWSQRHNGTLRRALPYLVGAPVCLVLLYLFFESVSYEALSRALHL